MKNYIKKNKGITLVALVITIIILLILAGITISQLTGSGLFENARLAEQKSKEAQEKEKDIFRDYENKIKEKGQYQADKNIEKNNESLIGKIYNITESGIQNIIVNGEIYSANIIVYNKSLILDGITHLEGATLNSNIYEFGDNNTDVATETEDAKNMVIIKINGDLTINTGVIVTACKSDLRIWRTKRIIYILYRNNY